MPTQLCRSNQPEPEAPVPRAHQIHKKSQSAYAQHILNNRHEYGTIDEVMKLVKPTTQTSLLIPYETLFIQVHQQQGQLIAECAKGEPNPLFQLYLDTTQKYPTN
jgi:hypothetical protein